MMERWIRDRAEIEANYPPIYSAKLDSLISSLPELSHKGFQYYEDESGNTVIETEDGHYSRIMKFADEPRYFPFAVLRQLDMNMIRTFILKANDAQTGDIVIAKTSWMAVHRVIQEAEIMQICRHPNVVELVDMGVSGKRSYLITEWLPWGDLAEWVRDGNHFISDVAAVFNQSAHAVDNVNRRGYIYADAKPANIMFDRNGVAKLIDFENCSKIDGADNSAQNSVWVTDKYAPPEQKELYSDQQLFLQTDVFSMGAVLYEMVTGDQGYLSDIDRGKFVEGNSELAIAEDYREELSPRQQKALTGLLRQALATDYRKRQPNVRVLNEEVQSILSD